MRTIDLYLLRNVQQVSDWFHYKLHTDNFRISRLIFTFSLFPLYFKFAAEVPHLPQSFPVIVLIFLFLLMLQAFILTANRGTKLDHGSVQYVEIPVGAIRHLSLNWLRPYVIALVGITTLWFLWELFAWKFSVSLATGVPEKVFHAGVNFAQALLLCTGMYFLSCEKRRRKFFDYTVFAQ